MNRKGFASIIILAIVAAVLVTIGIWYYTRGSSSGASMQGTSPSILAVASSSVNVNSAISPDSIVIATSTSAEIIYWDKQAGFLLKYPEKNTIVTTSTPGQSLIVFDTLGQSMVGIWMIPKNTMLSKLATPPQLMQALDLNGTLDNVSCEVSYFESYVLGNYYMIQQWNGATSTWNKSSSIMSMSDYVQNNCQVNQIDVTNTSTIENAVGDKPAAIALSFGPDSETKYYIVDLGKKIAIVRFDSEAIGGYSKVFEKIFNSILFKQ